MDQVRRAQGGMLAILMALALSCAVRADIQTDSRVDEVHLNDGTVVECVILMETGRGVLIVELDPDDEEKTRQRIIPKSEIAKVVRGENDGTITGFQTDAEFARKVISKLGFRRSEAKKTAAKKGKDGKEDPKAPTGPTGPVGPVAKTEPATPKDTPASKTKPTKIAGDGANTKLAPKEIADAYLTRFPELRDAAQTLLGVDRVPQVIEQAIGGDALALQQLESIVKPFLNPKPGVFMDAPANGGNGKPVKGFNKRKTPRNTPAPAPQPQPKTEKK